MMKNKIAVMAIVVLLGFTVFAVQDVKADAEGIQGYAIASEQDGDWYADGNVQWIDGVGNWYGNVTAIDLDDPGVSTNGADDALNDIGDGANANDQMDQFNWDASGSEPKGWFTPPATNNRMLYLAQYDGLADGLNNNYVFSGYIEAVGTNVPADPLELCLRYEPIPKPTLKGFGDGWIDISISHFNYTDWDQSVGTIHNRGTFDTFDSYTVYIRGEEYADWTYLGNSVDDPDNPQVDPALAAFNGGAPTTADTGADHYNATGLNGGIYEFAVGVNFDIPGGGGPVDVWGPATGAGSATTFLTSAPSAPIDNGSEFATGMLIPVVATIGMFAAFTIYRRKKDN